MIRPEASFAVEGGRLHHVHRVTALNLESLAGEMSCHCDTARSQAKAPDLEVDRRVVEIGVRDCTTYIGSLRPFAGEIVVPLRRLKRPRVMEVGADHLHVTLVAHALPELDCLGREAAV